MVTKWLVRGFTTFFTVLFTVMLGLTTLANVSESDINQMLGTTSTKIVETGEVVDTEYFKKKTNSIEELMQNKLKIIEQITDEGTVLLKNENDTLPLKGGKNVTLFGKASYNSVYGGKSGNAAIGNSGNVNINFTFKRGLEDAGFSVNADMWNYYAGKNLAYTSAPTEEVAPSELPMDSVSAYKDAGVVVFSRVTGEGSDAASDYYELVSAELNLLKAVEDVCDKVIVIINSPSPIAIHALKTDAKVGAILQIGGLGARSGIDWQYPCRKSKSLR